MAKTASPSGRQGLPSLSSLLSSSLPQVESYEQQRQDTLYLVVEACAMILPPMSFLGSELNMADPSTWATTWLVTTTATPNSSDSLRRDEEGLPVLTRQSHSQPDKPWYTWTLQTAPSCSQSQCLHSIICPAPWTRWSLGWSKISSSASPSRE